jgi:hypothetical protein
MIPPRNNGTALTITVGATSSMVDLKRIDRLRPCGFPHRIDCAPAMKSQRLAKWE